MANLNEKNARLANKRRQTMRRRGILAALGCVVVVATAAALMAPAISMTKGELTCGIEEHEHGDACYEQVIVCGQEESEGHVHSDACYEQVIVCGLEEGEDHAHSDECYESQLVCGLEESEGHVHTDACYESQLTCDKPEHTHTDACYEHEQANDDNAVSDEADGESNDAENKDSAKDGEDKDSAKDDEAKMPAVEFEKTLEREGEPDVKVSVKAPEGALPEGTTMEAKLIPAEDVRSKVEEAIERENGEEAKIKSITAVDIVFKDKDGNEIEPAKAVEVKITSDDVREFDDPLLVHVLDKSKESSKDNPYDAEIVAKVKIVNEDDDDKTVGTEDTMRFEAEAFSPYVIVELESITVPFTASDGSTYEVTVTYGPEAGIPDDAELVVTEVTEEDADYDEYVEQTAEAVGVDSDALTYIKLLDISIMVGEEKIQPQEPVDVQIRLMDKEESEDSTKVVHFDEEATEVVDADVSDETVEFEAAGFSIYAVTSYPSTTSDLDGKTFTIVHENDNPYGYEQFSTYYGRALQAAQSSSPNYLKAEIVRVEQHTNGYYVTTDRQRTEAYTDPEDQIPITQWEFTLVNGTTDEYYIKDTVSGQYLNMGPSVSSNYYRTVMSDERQPMKVTKVSGTNKFQISCTVGSTTRYLRDNDTSANTAAGNNAKYFTFGTSAANFTRLSLYETEFFDRNGLYPEYSGEKVSAKDLKDDKQYLIYRNEYASFADEYGDYVLDGNGDPVLAVDNGDSIALRSKYSPVWTLHVVEDTSGNPSTYYIFENEDTGTILLPNMDGTLVVESPWEPEEYTNNMTLPGKESRNYTSNFAYWDGSGAYIGYQIVENEDHTAMVTKPGRNSADASVNQSQQFSFAEVKESGSSTELHPVTTVDTNALGIKMRLFDYGSQAQMNTIMGRPSLQYENGNVTYDLVSRTIDPSTGFPTFTGNGSSASNMFGEGSTYYKGPANQLFLDDIYESSGFLEYACFNNFAHYNQTEGKFEVYAERGSPEHDGSGLKFSWQRGNFFPFNSLDPNTKGWNLFDDSGQLLDFDNPNYADALYDFNEATNYWFGMTMDFTFLMPEGGLINGEPMIYEFNGDDDLWIYIDGVLTLDIGGIHSAIPGTINFETGVITNGATNGNQQIGTIKECFKAAGVFPDGTQWDENRVGEYFSGETFAYLGSHDFKMMYAEHGAGASNLKMRFNMPIVERGQFTVEKELKGNVQSAYANMQFAYQAFIQKSGETGQCELIDENTDVFYVKKVNESTGIVEDVSTLENPIPVPFYNNEPIGEQTFDGVFYLKPGEKVAFKNRVDDLKYYVQEIGILDKNHGGLITQVDIGSQDNVQGTPMSPGSHYYNYATDERTVRNRAEVKFANHVEGENLRITKVLEEGSVNVGDTFEFRVMLENEAGKLYQYSYGHYAVVDKDGTYYRYANGRYYPVGTTPNFENTAGQFGAIEGIEPGMTIIIKDLVPGTEFYVDEIRVAPKGDPDHKTYIEESGWIPHDPAVINADPGTISQSIFSYYPPTPVTYKDVTSLGSIKRDASTDAQITFKNEAKNKIEIYKEWGSDDPEHPENNFVTQHGDVRVALFKEIDNHGVITYEYIDDTLMTIHWPQQSSSIDAYKVNSVAENVVVREVVVTGEGDDQVVTPIDENGAIAVSGEKTILTTGDDTVINTYVVTYKHKLLGTEGSGEQGDSGDDPGTEGSGEQGDSGDDPGTEGSGEQGDSGDNPEVDPEVDPATGDTEPKIRQDTVVNTMPQLVVNKHDENGDPLVGTKFMISKDGTSPLAGYGTNGYYVSTDVETGNLIPSPGIYLSNGDYYLVETETVNGYNKLGYKVKLHVSADDVTGATIITAASDPASAASFTDETDSNHLLYTFNVVNSPGVELPMVGGPGTMLYTLGGLILIVTAVGIYGFGSRRVRGRRSRG